MKLTREQIDAAVERIEAKPVKARTAFLAREAESLGVSPNALRWHCVRAGLLLSETTLKPTPETVAPVTRNGFPVRRFTAEEDARLLALEAEGLGTTAIGKKLGRRSNTITGRLATLARRAEAL